MSVNRRKRPSAQKLILGMVLDGFVNFAVSTATRSG